MAITDNRQRAETQMYLNAARRSRMRNERIVMRNIRPNGSNPPRYTDEELARAEFGVTSIAYTSRLAGYANRAQTLYDNSGNKTNEYRQSLQEIVNLVNQLNRMGPYDAFTAQDINDAEQLEQRIQQILIC